MKKLIIGLLSVLILISISACSGEPSLYNAPKGAPYEGLYEIDRMNYSASHTHKAGTNTFKVTMEWSTKDENVDYAEYNDEYYLEWTSDESLFPYDLIEIEGDTSSLKNNIHTIKPGDKVEILFDYDSYFDDIPIGYFKFVKVFDVYYKDGTKTQTVASFSYTLD